MTRAELLTARFNCRAVWWGGIPCYIVHLGMKPETSEVALVVPVSNPNGRWHRATFSELSPQSQEKVG